MTSYDVEDWYVAFVVGAADGRKKNLHGKLV